MEKIHYDFYYLKHMSFWFDLRILFETIKIVCAGLVSASTEVGPLNQVVHVWKYASQADREKKRDALMADPAFKEYLAKSRELGAHQSQECRILKSTSFSPL